MLHMGNSALKDQESRLIQYPILTSVLFKLLETKIAWKDSTQETRLTFTGITLWKKEYNTKRLTGQIRNKSKHVSQQRKLFTN